MKLTLLKTFLVMRSAIKSLKSCIRIYYPRPTLFIVCVAFFISWNGIAAGTAQAQKGAVIQSAEGDSTDLSISTDTVRAAVDRSVTIKQAIQIALANNNQIKRALLDIKNANQEVRKAWAEVIPELNGNMNYTRNIDVPVNFLPEALIRPGGSRNKLVPVRFGTDNNWQGGFSVQQVLFNGRAFVGISTSRLFKTAQSERFRQTAQQIVTRTRKAYYGVLIARENVRLQKERIERLEKNLKTNRARHKAGMIDDYQVLQVEVQLSNVRPQLTEARFNLQKAYRQLKMVMGIPLKTRFSAIGDLQGYDLVGKSAEQPENAALKHVNRMTPMVLDSTDWLLKKASRNRGDLRALAVRAKLQDKQIKAIKSRYLPTLNASYNLNWRAVEPGSPDFFGTSEQRSKTQAVMFTLSMPIFKGLTRDADLTQARIKQQDLRLQREQARRHARNEIASAKESLKEALQTINARKLALKKARRGYRMARARLKEGVGSQLNVTNAELELRQAELHYAQTVYDFLTAKANYDQAIGMVPFVDEDIRDIK